MAPRTRRSGFVLVPLDMRSPYGLAALACIITATPGTIWVNTTPRGHLLLHVLDLVDEEAWVRTIKGNVGASADGDLRMSAALLSWTVLIAQVMLVPRHGLRHLPHAARAARAGPRARARHALRQRAMLLLVFGIRTGSTVYFEAALLIALLGFVATAALAKFLMRGEVIE